MFSFVVFPGADLHRAFIWADIRGRTWEDPLHKKSMQVPGYEDMATSRRYTLVGPRTGGSLHTTPRSWRDPAGQAEKRSSPPRCPC